MKSKVFKLAELFCGPGGLSYGLTQARFRSDGREFSVASVWANDIDQDACSTYSRNIHDRDSTHVVCSPVEGINFKKIPAFNALAFGFPCNDFSLVGEHKGFRGKYGPLYTYGVRAIEIHNPEWFIAENVSGLRSANNGEALERILSDLEYAGAGYNVTAHLYKFEEYGVPQTRHRIVIVGMRKELGLMFRVPAPTTQNRYVTAREALELPPISAETPNNEITRQAAVVVERLRHIPPGMNAWHEGLPKHLQLNVPRTRMSQIYKRLHPDKPAYTITGSGGGGTHAYHWKEHRALTNRERARIQTFPDSYVFEGSKESVRKQIGMAVPPRAAEIIGRAILQTFAGRNYPSVEANVKLSARTKAIWTPIEQVA